MTERTTYYVMEISDESAAQFPENYDWDSELSQRNHRNYVTENKKIPPFQPYLEQEIYDDSEFNKINDFIYGPVERYCISEKVKTILGDFRLPDHRYYPVKVFKLKYLIKILWLRLIKLRFKVNSKYFALYYNESFISDKLGYIDFNRTRIAVEMSRKREQELGISTEFELREIFNEQTRISRRLNEPTDVNGKSKIGFEDEYKSLLEDKIYKFETDRIYFTNKFDHSLDLFEIRQFSWMTYISERLKNRLEEEKITGLIISKPGERQYKVKRPNPELIWD